MLMPHDDRDETLKRIRQAFEVQRRALQVLEEAMLQGFEQQSHDGHNGDHRLLSVQEVSEQLGMGRSWVYNQIRSGELPSVQLGGTVKIKREDLEQYIQSHHRSSSFKAGEEEEE
jgi:excisionase family DNA binding protein